MSIKRYLPLYKQTSKKTPLLLIICILLVHPSYFNNNKIGTVSAQPQPLLLRNQIQYRPVILEQPIPINAQPVYLGPGGQQQQQQHQTSVSFPNTAYFAYSPENIPPGAMYPNFLNENMRDGRQIALPPMRELPIMELLCSQSRFSKIAQILKLDSQIFATLKNFGPVTIFAPTNDALGRMPSGALEWIVAHPPLLRRFIETHIIRGLVVMAEDLHDEDQFIAVDGTVHYITQDATGNLEIDEAARIFMAEKDEIASTGIIHGIGNVLLPSGIQWPVGLPKCKKMCVERQRPALVMPLCVRRCAEKYDDF